MFFGMKGFLVRESRIDSDMASLGEQIKSLQAQIGTERKVITKTKKVGMEGVVEAVFSVLLAPVGGGLSLMLAVIRLVSITEAEG